MTPILLALVILAVSMELFIGVRLIRLARRTGGVPEALWGWAWVLDGVSQVGAELAKPFAGAWWADVGLGVFTALGSGALVFLAVSIWFVFRPDERSLRYLVTALSGALVLSLMTFVALGHVTLPEGDGMRVMRWINRTVAGALLAWGFVESTWAHQASLRQLRLGLVTPLEVLRFRLWSVAAASLAAFLALLIAKDTLGRGSPELWEAIVRIAQPLLAFLAVGCMWLTFFPTAGMHRRFGGEHGG